MFTVIYYIRILKCTLIAAALLASIKALSQERTSANSHSIIPQPLIYQSFSGNFKINSDTRIVTDANLPDLVAIASELHDKLDGLVSLRNGVESNLPDKDNYIHLKLNAGPDSLGKEGYQLSVRENHIEITALTAHGLFYGMQSLLQLFPLIKQGTEIVLPAGLIIDKPRFEWRGLMLDVGRYFYTTEFIKKYIDYLAMHKMNTFHWHLTEDHGWRIEIKKYPRLTEVGAWRPGTQFERHISKVDKNPHGGFYTQDQIREIVAYAKSRYVTVVPEIEMPGHALAALVTYPELSCTGGPFKMPVLWAIQKDVFCAGNEKTFEFLEGVLSEIAELFPSPIIHIGGDEAPKDRWKACEKCQKRIKDEGLKNEDELQSYFIKRIELFLRSKGKKIIGWDEILDGGLAPNATVMSWRENDSAIAAAKQKHDVIITPMYEMYLNMYQGEPYLEPSAWGGLITLGKAYAFEPVPAALSKVEAQYIKGVQGSVWAEYIHSPEMVEYMTFPRIAAVAEIAWTMPALKNWEDFKRRMEVQYYRYESLGINFSMSAYNVWIKSTLDKAQKKAIVTLNTESYLPEIRYTTDGSEPHSKSTKYNGPFSATYPVTIKAASFRNGEMISKINHRTIIEPLTD